MIGKYDFVILYEHRARELENAVILAMLLEKKGYKVAIEYRRSARYLFQKTDVVIVPFFYNDENVVDFTIQPFRSVSKVINLQYEQLFTESDEDSGILFPHDHAINANHIAWGEQEKKLMLKNGISEDNVFCIGNIAIDLNKKEFDKLFYDRAYLAQRFKLSDKKKWHLFISSFSYVGISEANIKQLSDYVSEPERFMDISVLSQQKMLEWYETFLNLHDDVIIIYRPHPGELDNKQLNNMQKKYSNFRVISDYSIRQWIRVCDSISSWYSTALVDVFFAGKKCSIVRPIEIPEDLDFSIYKDQTFIKDYDEYERCIKDVNSIVDIDDKMIRKYYNNVSNDSSFEKLVNLCVDVRENNINQYDYIKIMKNSKEKPLKYHIYRALMGIASIVDYKKIAPHKYRDDIMHTYIESKAYKKEINRYRTRFKSSGIL